MFQIPPKVEPPPFEIQVPSLSQSDNVEKPEQQQRV